MARLLLLTSLALTAPTSADFDRAWSEFVDGIENLLKEQGMVGGAIWFFKDGEPIAKEFYGLADIEQHRPVDEQTIFHWASVTKTLTGIAIMQLRDRGKLSLDDPVIDYLPELRAVHNPYGDMSDITIRHVMTHSAGFRDATWPWGGDEPWQPFEPTEWSQLVAMFPYTEVLFEPGSRYSYSNPAVIFLGRIIEILSGEPFEAYVDKNIFKPLGMYRSYFDTTPYHLIGFRSNNYVVENGKPKANGLDFNTGITVSNSGWNAPIGDLGRFAAFLVGDPADPSRYDVVLARSSLEEMWRPALPMTDPVVAPSEVSKDHIGLIFFISDRNGHRIVGHTGSQQAFRAFLYVDPEARTAAIAAFNAQGVEKDGVRRPDAESILGTVRERLLRDIFPLFWK